MKHRWLGPWRASFDSCTNAAIRRRCQRIGGDERGDGVERPSPEEPSLRRQSTTLIVSQPELPATKLLFEDPVLFDQVGDNVLLMPMHPARNRQQEQLERESSGRHSAIVGALNAHAHRQLRTDPFFAQGGHCGMLFYRLAQQAVQVAPVPYTAMVKDVGQGPRRDHKM